MANTLRPYTDRIRTALVSALCIQTFPCQSVERQSKPEVEYQGHPELLLPPVTVTRAGKDACLIEPSINSVRVSLKIHQADNLELVLTKMLMKFLMQRAETLSILRRVPVEGYDISFLVTDEHILQLGKHQVIDFVCAFVDDVYAEVNQLKLAVNSRGRAMATELLRSLAF